MLKFVDFCAGIGGGRLGLESCGLKCMAYSEIDENPVNTYKLFFGEKEINLGDLTKIDCNNIPNFDIMIAGFPCQTFSILGKRKGFNDLRGQVIYSLMKILSEKKVKYFIMENVKGLVNHNSGKTIKTILDEFNKINYKVEWKVLDSQNYGVPQMRERVYFVGIQKKLIKNKKKFTFPSEILLPNIEDYLSYNKNTILSYDNITFQKYLNNKYNKNKFDIKKILEQDYLILDTRQSDLRLYNKKCPTLRAGRHGILYVKDGQLKKLSGYEALLLQGFPRKFAQTAMEEISESKILTQAGNAMTVTTISAIANQLIKYINEGELND